MSTRETTQINRWLQCNSCDKVGVRCYGAQEGALTHTWGIGQYSDEEMVSAEQDVWQRQPDIRRPGMGKNMACSRNMTHTVELEQSGGLVTNSEE